MSEQTTQEQIVEMDINLLRTFKDHPFKVTADYPMIQLKESIANVNHFFTLLGKMFFTPYGKEFFTSLSKQIFTS